MARLGGGEACRPGDEPGMEAALGEGAQPEHERVQAGASPARGRGVSPALSDPGASFLRADKGTLHPRYDSQDGQGVDGRAWALVRPAVSGREACSLRLGTSAAPKPKLHSAFLARPDSLSTVSIIAFQESPVFQSIFAKMGCFASPAAHHCPLPRPGDEGGHRPAAACTLPARPTSAPLSRPGPEAGDRPLCLHRSGRRGGAAVSSLPRKDRCVLAAVPEGRTYLWEAPVSGKTESGIVSECVWAGIKGKGPFLK